MKSLFVIRVVRMTVVWSQDSRVTKKFQHRYPFHFSALLRIIYHLREFGCIIHRKPKFVLVSEKSLSTVCRRVLVTGL